MSLNATRPRTDVMSLASHIVSAYVASHPLSRPDLPKFILSVHAALSGLPRPPAQKPKWPLSVIPIERTITPDYIISLEDGKKYKTLKRHLRSRGLTPEQYRTKWDLPADYPLAASNYRKQRSERARQLGFGEMRKGKAPSAHVAQSAS